MYDNSQLIVWRCPQCGLRARTPSFPIVCACGLRDEDGGQTAPPGLVEKAGNLAVATAKHLTTGLKKVTEEEMLRRVAACEQCPGYDQKKLVCNHCGCKSFADHEAWLNKASWSKTTCPRGLWPA